MDPKPNQFEESQRVKQFDSAQEALPDSKETCFAYESNIAANLGGINPMLGEKSGGTYDIQVKHFEIRNGMAEYLDERFPEGIDDVPGSLKQLAHDYYEHLQEGIGGGRYTDARRDHVIQSILNCEGIYRSIFSKVDMQLANETIGAIQGLPVGPELSNIVPLSTAQEVMEEFGDFLKRNASLEKHSPETQYEMFLVARHELYRAAGRDVAVIEQNACTDLIGYL
jgi:hypothetical protein